MSASAAVTTGQLSKSRSGNISSSRKEAAAVAKRIRHGRLAVAAWDVDEGKRLYESGMKCTKIAEKLGTTPAAVRGYAHRHWITPVAKPDEADLPVGTAKAKPKPELEPEPVQISRVTGMPKLGPCGKDCDNCCYVFRPGAGGTQMCDYYLQTGRHRHPDEHGKCAVKVQTGRKRYEAYHEGLERAKAKRAEARKQRKPRAVAWDTVKAHEMWVQGYMYKDISAVVGSSATNICNYAGKNWSEDKPLRDAAIERMGG